MKKSINLPSLIVVLFFTLSVAGCSGGGFNLFTIQDDIELGKQLEAEIAASPEEFPVLNPTQYPEAYSHMKRIRDNILNSGKVTYKNEFEWSIKIIHDDETLNAFAAPGGYIYVYTGLIKFLDTEAQLAGVLGHEIAHADQRHSTEQLTKAYGLQILVALVSGNPNTEMIAQIAAALTSLKFSRKAESEADKFSVTYLCPTKYHADGAAGFFQKMEGQPTPPEFLSTHPNPGKRVEAITAEKEAQGCTNGAPFDARYVQFKASLP